MVSRGHVCIIQGTGYHAPPAAAGEARPITRNTPHAGLQLETDKALLLKKAQSSVRTYGMHYVVANMLQTRYHRVTIVGDKVWFAIRAVLVCGASHAAAAAAGNRAGSGASGPSWRAAY